MSRALSKKPRSITRSWTSCRRSCRAAGAGRSRPVDVGLHRADRPGPFLHPHPGGLAESIGADKTRIIPTLDELQEHGHIERNPDPEDRRARLLAITESGRSIKNAAQVDIQRGEERWLGPLSAHDRSTFLRVLRQLTFGS